MSQLLKILSSMLESGKQLVYTQKTSMIIICCESESPGKPRDTRLPDSPRQKQSVPDGFRSSVSKDESLAGVYVLLVL